MFFRKRQDQGMEDRLRGLSAEPRDDFVRSLATEVRSSRVRTAMRSRRVLAAVVTSGLILIPFAAFGGVGYAAQAAKSAAQSVSGGGSQSSARPTDKAMRRAAQHSEQCQQQLEFEHARHEHARRRSVQAGQGLWRQEPRARARERVQEAPEVIKS
jgi:hypothetical protein